MRVTIKALCVLLFGLSFAAGCGQKGPLFLPGDPSTIKTDVPNQPQPQPQSEDDNSDDDDDDKEQQ